MYVCMSCLQGLLLTLVIPFGTNTVSFFLRPLHLYIVIALVQGLDQKS